MSDSNEDAPPPADVVDKPEEPEDDKVSYLTQALPTGKRLSNKANATINGKKKPCVTVTVCLYGCHTLYTTGGGGGWTKLVTHIVLMV